MICSTSLWISVAILISSAMRAKRREIEAKLSLSMLSSTTTPDAIIGRSQPQATERNLTMSSHIQGIHGLALGIVLTVALSGCATYEKCGLGGCPGDARITENVQAQLDKHPELGPPNSIQAQTLNQVVYLNGMTATGLERSEAESVAQQAPGVGRIVNLISVTH